MALKDDLLPLVDTLRAIPGELGFRPYQVWVRKVVWSGARVGLGSASVTETRLLVGGRDPKVREIRSKDVVAGSVEYSDADYEIGPLTPEFAGGGVAESTINPTKNGQPTEVTFLVKGPGMPTEGLICQRVESDLHRPLRAVIKVRSTGRKRP